ncbi:hypothetical protein ACLRDC_13500 [Gluconacetobacter sacchari]|uniref:hypothetical protein n=1 Tax=Gluconacetobacter sacchari TaxID=92759 RepID=UPI0015FF107F|nr:hypothetical protein [Gluconacetobacter sacchari]
MVAAVACARRAPGQIATLILPADTAWSPAERIGLPVSEPLPATSAESTLERVASLLRGPGRSAMLLRGDVLHGHGLQRAARIAARTGAMLFCDTFAPRIRRGGDHPVIERLHYRGDEVIRQLAAAISIGPPLRQEWASPRNVSPRWARSGTRSVGPCGRVAPS